MYFFKANACVFILVFSRNYVVCGEVGQEEALLNMLPLADAFELRVARIFVEGALKIGEG